VSSGVAPALELHRFVGVPTIVRSVTDSATPGAWISEYDYPNRRVTLTLADSEAVGHHWTGIRKDQSSAILAVTSTFMCHTVLSGTLTSLSPTRS
jgi:hypothetical protein